MIFSFTLIIILIQYILYSGTLCTHLRPEDYEFLDALILGQSSPEEAYKRFDELSAKHVELLRKGTKHIQDASTSAPFRPSFGA